MPEDLSLLIEALGIRMPPGSSILMVGAGDADIIRIRNAYLDSLIVLFDYQKRTNQMECLAQYIPTDEVLLPLNKNRKPSALNDSTNIVALLTPLSIENKEDEIAYDLSVVNITGLLSIPDVVGRKKRCRNYPSITEFLAASVRAAYDVSHATLVYLPENKFHNSISDRLGMGLTPHYANGNLIAYENNNPISKFQIFCKN